MDKDKFYDEFYDALTESEDELKTILFTANQKKDQFLAHPLFRDYPAEDARIMAMSLGIAIELLRRYENYQSE